MLANNYLFIHPADTEQHVNFFLSFFCFPGISPFLGFTSATAHLTESEMEVKVSASVEEIDVISQLSGNLSLLVVLL